LQEGRKKDADVTNMYVVEPANRKWSFLRVGSAMAEAAGVSTIRHPDVMEYLRQPSRGPALRAP